MCDFQVISGNLIGRGEPIHGFKHDCGTGNHRDSISVLSADTNIIGDNILADQWTDGIVNKNDIVFIMVSFCNIGKTFSNGFQTGFPSGNDIFQLGDAELLRVSR